MHATIREIRCVRCASPIGIEHQPGAGTPVALFDGCPACKAQEIVANLTVEVDLAPARAHVQAQQAMPTLRAPGLWRYGSMLPITAAGRTSLGEGDTPLMKLERFGRRIGLSRLYVKDESQQPTWSYKDRLCAVAVSHARDVGAKVITVSSTGNHGAATAAYAARAGLPCVAFTTAAVPAVMKTLMQAYGAYVVALPSAWDRWTMMSASVHDHGWYPTSGYVFPPMGSNPFGTEGYKTIAYETYEQLGQVPDWFAIPTCFGDGLLGVWKGWSELKAIGLVATTPRMLAAEVFGSLEATLETDQHLPVEQPMTATPAFSIATPLGTQQSLLALRQSNGLARHVRDQNLLELQRQLAQDEGIYAEASAVVSLAAAARLRREGRLDEDACVVCLLTSTGLKDPTATAGELPPVPLIQPDLGQLARALKETYGVDLF